MFIYVYLECSQQGNGTWLEGDQISVCVMYTPRVLGTAPNSTREGNNFAASDITNVTADIMQGLCIIVTVLLSII